MEAVVPWSSFLVLIDWVYHKSTAKGLRPPLPWRLKWTTKIEPVLMRACPAACIPVGGTKPQYPAAPCAVGRYRGAEAAEADPRACPAPWALGPAPGLPAVAASITSECNGSGVRKGSKGPYRARGNAPGLPVAAESCCALNIRTTFGRSTSSSIK